MHLATANAASGEECGHREADGLLQIAEVSSCCIGATKARHIVLSQRLLQVGEIVGRDNTITIKEDEVLAGSPLNAIIASNATTLIVLIIIMCISLLGISFDDVTTGLRRTVLDNHHLKVLDGLSRQTTHQVFDFIAPIVNRYYDRKIGHLVLIKNKE